MVQAKAKGSKFECELLRQCREINPDTFRTTGSGAVDYDQGDLIFGPYLIECFPEGHLIQTPFGYKNIEDIQQGEDVVSHKGFCRKVNQVMYRIYEGELLIIKIAGLPEMRCTPEHPFYVVRNNKKQFVKAKNLKKKDLVLTPVAKLTEKTNYAAPGLLRLLGYYVAEGRADERRVSWYMATKDANYIEDLERLIYDFCGKKPGKIVRGTTTVVNLYSTHWCEWFKLMAGSGSENKKTPNLAWSNKQTMIEFLRGYYRGDGHASGPVIHACSTSHELIYQLRGCLLTLGIIPRITVAGKGQLQIRIYGEDVLKAQNIFFDKKPTKKLTAKGKIKKIKFEDEEYLSSEVETITFEQFKGLVYNLDVETEDSYVCNGVAVHNCKHHKDFTDGLLEKFFLKAEKEAEARGKIPLLVHKTNRRKSKVMFRLNDGYYAWMNWSDFLEREARKKNE